MFNKRLPILICLLALSFSLIGESNSRAQSVASGPAAIRVAAIWAAPLASQALFEPAFLEHLSLMASHEIWEVGKQSSWPLVDGRPEVDTRQLNELWHTVKKYQTKQKIRAMYRIGYKQLQRLNPNVDIDQLQEGQQLLVWVRTAQVSESRGRPDRGRLRFGEPLPPGEGYMRLFPHRSFGTYYTISEIVRVLDNYKSIHPNASPLIVGDLGFRTGRRIHPHHSHRSGRDADITYPRLDEPPNYSRFHHIRRKNFDVEKTFWLLKDFIDGGQVEYIFVNRRWQRLLRKFGEENGATDEWLNATFQVGSMRPGKAIIRHAKGHDKHFHVRFKCQETDRRCY